MALTDFQKRKIKDEFKRYDNDCNGLLEEKDYLMVLENYKKIFCITDANEKFQAMKKFYMKQWHDLKTIGDKNNDGKISPEEFLTLYCQLLSSKEHFF